MRKIVVLASALLCLSSAAMAQKGINVGLHLAGGQVFSKNIAIPKDSPYYVKNSAGLMYGGGLDLAFGIDDFTSIQSGVSYVSRQFNLTPTDSLGNTYPELSTTKGLISIPLMVRQRFPLGKSNRLFANVMMGQSLDIVKFDSTTTFTTGALTAGSAYSRREVVYPKKMIPTVLLGAGIDFASAKGSALNVSLVWGISPYRLLQGDIKEFDALVNNYDASTDPEGDADPAQFPSYYYDYAMRGSYLSLRLQYWLNFKLGKKTSEEGDGGSAE
jgi:hypothetical protein